MSEPSPTSEDRAERVQHHFEDAASQFDGLYQREHDENRLQRFLRPGLFVRANAAADLVRTFDAPRVLDVGCGSGRVGELMLDAGARDYVGIDFSQPMLDLAAERLKRFEGKVSLITSDFLEGEIVGRFDVVAALGFFDYLDRPELFTKRMHELTAEGGAAIASFPRWTWVKGPIRKVRYEWVNKVPIFDYTEEQLRDLFAAFDRVEIDQQHAGFLVRAHRS